MNEENTVASPLWSAAKCHVKQSATENDLRAIKRQAGFQRSGGTPLFGAGVSCRAMYGRTHPVSTTTLETPQSDLSE